MLGARLSATGKATTFSFDSVEKIARPGNNVTQIKRPLGGVDVLTDESGNVDRSMHFDTWRQQPDAATGQPLAESASSFVHCKTTLGFTGHGMLDEVGVVHERGAVRRVEESRGVAVFGARLDDGLRFVECGIGDGSARRWRRCCCR